MRETKIPRLMKKIFLVSALHWAYYPFFLAFFGASFKYGQFRNWFFLLAAITVLSWFPCKGCPLTVWENKLREKANIPKRKLFGLAEIIDRGLKKFFGVGLPRGTTFALVTVMVIARIWAG
jgi:hypothetical protein